MSNVVGFNTPSKRKAIQELNSPQKSNFNPAMLERLQGETKARVAHLTELSMGQKFSSLPDDAKMQIMADLMYYKGIADAL